MGGGNRPPQQGARGRQEKDNPNRINDEITAPMVRLVGENVEPNLVVPIRKALEMADEINEARLAIWNRYYENLLPLKEAGRIDLPVVPEGCVHNAHMFYIKAKDLEERTAFIDFLKERGIMSVFHYVPLHSAPAGMKYGRFHGEDKYTTKESERLARLPLYYGLSLEQVDFICEAVKAFYE